MAGTIEIFNMALGQIGSTETVMDLNERSLSLQSCVRYWSNARDSVLSDFPWSFATKQQQLALTTSTPVNWLHQYLLPNDCLRVQRIVIPDEPVSVGMLYQLTQNPPYELAWSESGTVLKCDQNPCLLQYTMRIDDDGRFPPEFVSMVSMKLAASICVPLKSDPGLAGNLEEQYLTRLQSAQATALNQQQDFPYNYNWQGEFRSL
jgi:hypothetical protein